MQSLCEACSHRKEVVYGTGSRFLLCQFPQTDRRFQKYPPQPAWLGARGEPARVSETDRTTAAHLLVDKANLFCWGEFAARPALEPASGTCPQDHFHR